MNWKNIAAHWGPELERRRLPELYWKMLLARWVELDPKRALEVATALGEWRLADWCYRVWSVQEPLSALDAAKQDTKSELALIAVAGELARQHLQRR